MSAAKKWVLLVDDEPDVRETLKELVKIGFPTDVNIVEAKDGADATAKINHQMFDCIISDIKMPKKDGKALITSIRQNPFNNRTPVIVLTGFPEDVSVDDHPFVYLLKKPFQHQEIMELLTTQLKIGAGGGRLAADILNNIIGSVGSFLRHIAGQEDYIIDSPRSKAKGESVTKEYLSKIDFVVDGVGHSFSILASGEELAKVGEKSPSIKGADLAKISFGIGHSVLNYTLKRVNMLSMQKINVDCLQGKEVNDFCQSRSGIIIPIKVGGLTLEVFASVHSKK